VHQARCCDAKIDQPKPESEVEMEAEPKLEEAKGENDEEVRLNSK
jgi:hypothetical protein